ncbi:beta-N-acetylhexosaminidase [Salinimicrobium gaetbulicola]|uniref:beta-N-acetylhexosaminidase n=1 Tax=Salinimicrobium gaetbulicola TaxID=999702 RepID=A0ABW3IGM8_9FLAO
MKTFLKSTATILLLFLYSCDANKSESIASEDDTNEVVAPSIIPLPSEVNWDNKYYRLPAENIICTDNPETVSWLQKLLHEAGLNTSVQTGSDCGNWNVQINSEKLESLGEEGYELYITDKGVKIKAAAEAGVFYAVQTLRQMFPVEIEKGESVSTTVDLPQGTIQDQPTYQWRGTMVDMARSFFGLDYLKRHVDRMALYKMNRLHLHLTDDQGWRIEIKGKPKLTEIGSKGSVVRGRSGYLTQEEYLELQDYALARNIIIIPEIDMPGHIYSALLSYPELNCDNFENLSPKRATPPELFRNYNVGWSKLCLENPKIYEFVSEVIGEMAAITKGPWIHIGGDEIEDPRYKEFVVKADSIVRAYDKITIGWEEVTQAEVSPDLISQSWRGTVESVVPDIKVIHSLCSQFYFDHGNVPGQENTNNWCKKSGVSLEDAYSFDNEDPNIIGVEVPVWSEFVLTDEMMDNRFWPRAIAAAEIAWTPGAQRDYASFKKRLGRHGDRLRALNINFFRTPGIDWGKESKAGIFSNFLPAQ